MWQPVVLPDIGGPIRGFTFPQRGVMFVRTPGELIRVVLNPVEVQRVAAPDAAAALSHGGWLVWQGERHLVYDANGGDITLCDHPCGDRILPDADGTLLITDQDERAVRQRLPSIRLAAAGSWLWAGFSDDGRWLVAGSPAGMQVFRNAPYAKPVATANGGGMKASRASTSPRPPAAEL